MKVARIPQGPTVRNLPILGPAIFRTTHGASSFLAPPTTLKLMPITPPVGDDSERCEDAEAIEVRAVVPAFGGVLSQKESLATGKEVWRAKSNRRWLAG